MLLMSNTIGRPIVCQRNFVYRKATGSTLDTTTPDTLREYSTRRAPESRTPKEVQA